MIGTSIYISKNRLELLLKVTDAIGLSEGELLSLLLRKSRKLFGKSAVTGRAVRYQEGGGNDYVVHHISLRDADYELATGRRYLFKVSVSLIFALSISLFLEEIIYEWTHKRTDATNEWKKYQTNIHYNRFFIDHFDNVSSEIWHIPWPRE